MRVIDADKIEIPERINGITLKECIEGLEKGMSETDFHGDTHSIGCIYGTRDYLEWILKELEEAPTLDTEPIKHGHWVRIGMYDFCSCCNEQYDYGSQNYCGNCGAKMDEVSED